MDLLISIVILFVLAFSLCFYRISPLPLPPLAKTIKSLETEQSPPSPFRNYLWLNGWWEARWAGQGNRGAVPVPGIWEPKPLTRVPPIEYRHSFKLPTTWKGRRIFLRFDGCIARFHAALNGREIGSTQSWGLPSTLELTRHVTFDTSNLLELRVETSPEKMTFRNWQPVVGISCNVFLESVPAAFIRSISVITSISSNGNGRIKIEGSVDGEPPGTAIIMGHIVTPDGKPVLTFEKPLFSAGAEETNEFELLGMLEEPVIWSPSSPSLYRADVLLVLPNDTDGVSIPIGFRSFGTSGHRLLLNGEEIKLHGVNYFNDPGANPRNAVRRLRGDLRIIHDAGWNAVRFSPTLASEATLNECDRLGLLVLEEIPTAFLPADSLQKRDVFRSVEHEFRAMIEAHRHHPSVVMWGIGGDLPTQLPETRAFVKRMLNSAALLDARPVYVGTERLGDSRIANLVPVIALNLKNGERSISKIAQWQQRWQEKPVIVLNYGVEAVGGWRSARAARWSEDYQARSVRAFGNFLRQDTHVAGGFLNSFADFPDLSASFSPLPYLRLTGVFTRDRTAKLAFDAAAPNADRALSHIVVTRTIRITPQQQSYLVEILILVFLLPAGIAVWIFTGEFRPVFLGSYPVGSIAPSRISINRASDVAVLIEARRNAVPLLSGHKSIGSRPRVSDGLLILILSSAAISITLRVVSPQVSAAAEILPSNLIPIAVNLLHSQGKLLYFSFVISASIVLISALLSALFLRQSALYLTSLYARFLLPFIFIPIFLWLYIPLPVAFFIALAWSLFLSFRSVSGIFRVKTPQGLLLLFLSPVAVATYIVMLPMIIR